MTWTSVQPRFTSLGFGNTVDAVGMPFDELKLLDYLWRSVRKKRLWGFHDRVPHRLIHHAYQALSLDDERKTFHPNTWERPNNCADSYVDGAADAITGTSNTSIDASEQVIEQVWFAGVHSNIGGGYPKDSLSLISLDWMMGKANACGLQLLKSHWQEYRKASDAYGRLYDSRVGLGVFYRYARRDIYKRAEDPPPDNAKLGKVLVYTFKKLFGGLKIVERPCLPMIHKSVFDRIERGTNNYAPKVIREGKYIIAWSNSGPYMQPAVTDGDP